jgi:hypothetical protein
MSVREPVEKATAGGREGEADHAAVVRVDEALHEAGDLGPIDQLDGAVVAQEEVVGDVADGGRVGPGMAADGEQQLVLLGGEPDGGRLLTTPVQELAQCRAEGEQPLVIAVLETFYRHTI